MKLVIVSNEVTIWISHRRRYCFITWIESRGLDLHRFAKPLHRPGSVFHYVPVLKTPTSTSNPILNTCPYYQELRERLSRDKNIHTATAIARIESGDPTMWPCYCSKNSSTRSIRSAFLPAFERPLEVKKSFRMATVS